MRSTCSGQGKKPNVYKRLLRRFAASDFNDTDVVEAYFNKIDLRSKLGWRHLLGFTIVAVLQFDVVAANLVAPVTSHHLFSRLTNFSLKCAGEELFGANLDARHVRDVMIARNRTEVRDDPAVIPDMDATDLQRTLAIDYYFAPISQKFGPHIGSSTHKHDGAIPLGAFRSDDDRLEFTVSEGILAGGALAGLTVDPVQSLDVYGIFRDDEEFASLDQMPYVSGKNWAAGAVNQEIEFELARKHASREGRLRTAVIRYLEEDTNGVDFSDLAGISVTIDGEKVYDNLTVAEVTETRSFYGGNLSPVNDEHLELVPYHAWAPASELADGPVTVHIEDTGSQDHVRILQDETFAATPDMRAVIAEAYKMDPEQMVRTKPSARHISPDLLPQRVDMTNAKG